MKKIYATFIFLIALSSACDFDEKSLNASSVDDLEINPSPNTISSAALGLLNGGRVNIEFTVSTMGIFGREGYKLDPNNPASPDLFYKTLEQDIIANAWANAYRNIRQSNIVINAAIVSNQISNDQKEGVIGFAKTIKALDLMNIIMATDSAGAILDVPNKVTDELLPVANKYHVYKKIAKLLDEGESHLQNAGPIFLFTLPSGFSEFSTPATFNKFNRALKARVDILSGNFLEGLSALEKSFLDTDNKSLEGLNQGVYYNYSTNSGDMSNPLYDPTAIQRFAHPSIWAEAELRSDGTKDLRAQRKVFPISTVERFGFVVTEKIIVYNSVDASVPIIRNEELILLRAESNIGLGNYSSAINDINFIRKYSAGLPELNDPYNGPLLTLLDQLLYEKKYSLYWEGGHRWIDARRYGKLNELQKDRPNDRVFPYLPLPRDECYARNSEPFGCQIPQGQ